MPWEPDVEMFRTISPSFILEAKCIKKFRTANVFQKCGQSAFNKLFNHISAETEELKLEFYKQKEH